jgi:uncharacterized membrane protein
MLGPVRGGLSAGIGSYIFNLTSAGHFNVLPFQFVFRFAHAFVCGLIAKRGKNLAWMYAAAVAGQLTYIILLMLQRYWYDAIIVRQLTHTEAWIAVIPVHLPPSLINGIVAVAAAVPLALALQKAMRRIRS